jgi:predicted Zn-dependent peptidase
MPGVQSAAFTILVPAGAAFDPPDRRGSATMLAEWITRGAGDRDSRELLGALDDLGVTHGEAAQSVHTSMWAATLGRNLIPALSLYADILRRPHLDPEEVEPIRELCLQGLRSLEDDPGSKVVVELRERHFPAPWGHSPQGTPEGVGAATAEDLAASYQVGYRPNGAILAVAGAIDWSVLLETVGRLFGDWPKCGEPRVQLGKAGPSRDHLVKDTQQIQIALAYPTVTVDHPDYYRARAACAILGGYASARLFTEVREKRGLCYSVYSSYEAFKERAAILVHAGTSADRAQETLDVTLAELRRLASAGIEVEELDMMRAGLKSSLIMQQESTMSRSGALGSDWYYLGRVRPLEEISAALDALTPAAVGEFASRMPLEAMTLLTLGPRALSVPE